MQKAIDETDRRRKIQIQYNKEHNITPETIRKEIRHSLTEQVKARQTARDALRFGASEYDRVELAGQLERDMLEAAESLDFEKAAFLRDQLRELQDLPELILASRSKKDRARQERKTGIVARKKTKKDAKK
jgi:excinuclease ABC subunit B